VDPLQILNDGLIVLSNGLTVAAQVMSLVFAFL
jgi:hypothetical protein